MTRLIPYLPLLACPVAMGAMLWLVARGAKKPSPSTPPPTPAQHAELQTLSAELHALLSDDAERAAN